MPCNSVNNLRRHESGAALLCDVENLHRGRYPFLRSIGRWSAKVHWPATLAFTRLEAKGRGGRADVASA
jgi:hypothetical protein